MEHAFVLDGLVSYRDTLLSSYSTVRRSVVAHVYPAWQVYTWGCCDMRSPFTHAKHVCVCEGGRGMVQYSGTVQYRTVRYSTAALLQVGVAGSVGRLSWDTRPGKPQPLGDKETSLQTGCSLGTVLCNGAVRHRDAPVIMFYSDVRACRWVVRAAYTEWARAVRCRAVLYCTALYCT